MREIFIVIIDKIKKLFFGISLGLGIELIFAVVVSYLIERFITNNFDPQLFVIQYPLLVIFILSIYLVFWKKQYTLTAGLFLGFLLFMLFMTFLFEVLAGPASL